MIVLLTDNPALTQMFHHVVAGKPLDAAAYTFNEFDQVMLLLSTEDCLLVPKSEASRAESLNIPAVIQELSLPISLRDFNNLLKLPFHAGDDPESRD